MPAGAACNSDLQLNVQIDSAGGGLERLRLRVASVYPDALIRRLGGDQETGSIPSVDGICTPPRDAAARPIGSSG